MTNNFSEREKNIIRNKLLEKGREFFSTYGLKKTSVDELTRAVGIAKGSFYNFFNSKEELYFDIFELEEDKIQTQVISFLMKKKTITKRGFKSFLKESFRLVDENPIIKRIYFEDEYERLIRKLPEERLTAHAAKDQKALLPLIKKFQQSGQMIKKDPELIISMIRSLYTSTLHKKEIGEEIFDRTMDLLFELIANSLIIENKISVGKK